MLPVIKGTATHISEKQQRHVSHDNTQPYTGSSVHYSYTMKLLVDGQPAQLSSGKPKHIEEGDEVAISGFMWLGAMHGLTYKNISRSIPPSSNFSGGLIFGLVLLIGSVVLTQENVSQWGLGDLARPFYSDFFMYVRWGLRLVGGFAFLDGLRHLLAYLSVKDA